MKRMPIKGINFVKDDIMELEYRLKENSNTWLGKGKRNPKEGFL